MWDIVLANVEDAKKLAGSVLTTKTVRLQTDYMVSMLHGVHMDVTRGELDGFLLPFGQVAEVAVVAGKNGIPTGDYVFQVTLTRTNFSQVSDILTSKSFCCWGLTSQLLDLRCRWARILNMSQEEPDAINISHTIKIRKVAKDIAEKEKTNQTPQ